MIEQENIPLQGQDNVRPPAAADVDPDQARVRVKRQEAEALRGDPPASKDVPIGSYWYNHMARYMVTDAAAIKNLRMAYLKMKLYTKNIRGEDGVIRGFAKKKTNWNFYNAIDIISSNCDKYECYDYVHFPYKRAVKLDFQGVDIRVAPASDDNMYGICVDIDETRHVAHVIPFGFSFKGYLMCNPSTKLKMGDTCDFSNAGDVVKSVAPNLPTGLSMYALSDSFKLDLRTPAEKKDAAFREADFTLSMVKVVIYGNRIENKKA